MSRTNLQAYMICAGTILGSAQRFVEDGKAATEPKDAETFLRTQNKIIKGLAELLLRAVEAPDLFQAWANSEASPDHQPEIPGLAGKPRLRLVKSDDTGDDDPDEA